MGKRNKERKVTNLSELAALTSAVEVHDVAEAPATVPIVEAESSVVEATAEQVPAAVDHCPAVVELTPAAEELVVEATATVLIVEAAETIVEETGCTATEVAAANEPPVAGNCPAVVEPTPLQEIAALRAQIEALQAKRRVASGSRPRPNVTYTLLARPPKWHNTPQVAQLQKVLFDPAFIAAHTAEVGGKPVVEVGEPELFAAIEAAAATGALLTKQAPVRIFQYYKNDLMLSGSIRWR